MLSPNCSNVATAIQRVQEKETKKSLFHRGFLKITIAYTLIAVNRRFRNLGFSISSSRTDA